MMENKCQQLLERQNARVKNIKDSDPNETIIVGVQKRSLDLYITGVQETLKELAQLQKFDYTPISCHILPED